ncbi:MAG: hypothetical protein J0I12_30950 [Candidatus Eremiobacteraeota bacterium]|nr:hypothetical protein [Candidatus Eremiobacteraeota bacterium]
MRVLLLLLLLGGVVWGKPLQLELPQEKLTREEENAIRPGLDYILAFYRKLGYPTPESIRLRIFATYREYDSWRRGHSGAETNGGYFSPLYGEVVTWRSRRLPKTLVHEGNHAIFRTAFNDPPTWLNEGLSELFEEMEASGSLPNFPPHPQYTPRILRLPKGQIGKDILQVVNMNYATYHKSGYESHNYARAWALVYFLWKKGLIERMIPKLLNRPPQEDDLGTLHRAYLGGLPALERELEFFFRAGI